MEDEPRYIPPRLTFGQMVRAMVWGAAHIGGGMARIDEGQAHIGQGLAEIGDGMGRITINAQHDSEQPAAAAEIPAED